MTRTLARRLLLVAATSFFVSTFPNPALAQTASFTAQTFAAGANPQVVAVGDFNGDGKLDRALADFGPSTQRATTVSVLLGNGDGTFLPPLMFDAGPSPAFAAAGDFNGDGKLDLAVANYDAATVSVLLGNGNGTFQAARSFGAGSGPRSGAVGAFNGDGELDLAVAA